MGEADQGTYPLYESTKPQQSDLLCGVVVTVETWKCYPGIADKLLWKQSDKLPLIEKSLIKELLRSDTSYYSTQNM